MMALDRETLSLLVERTVLKTEREYAIVEKDYWVVWLLNLLFSGPYAEALTFKGSRPFISFLAKTIGIKG